MGSQKEKKKLTEKNDRYPPPLSLSPSSPGPWLKNGAHEYEEEKENEKKGDK